MAMFGGVHSIPRDPNRKGPGAAAPPPTPAPDANGIITIHGDSDQWKAGEAYRLAGGPDPGPSTAEANSASVGRATSAAARARKRASAGDVLLRAGSDSGWKSPGARVTPRTLVGGA